MDAGHSDHRTTLSWPSSRSVVQAGFKYAEGETKCVPCEAADADAQCAEPAAKGGKEQDEQ